MLRNRSWLVFLSKGIQHQRQIGYGSYIFIHISPERWECLLRNMYASQVVTVRTLYGKIDWFKIEVLVEKNQVRV